MKKSLFLFTLLLGIFVNLNSQVKNLNGTIDIATFEIASTKQLQVLLPQIEQEILNCHFVELRVISPLEVEEEQIAILQNFGTLLVEYEPKISLLWQDNFVCPAQNGMALNHYEWWRWNKPNLGINPTNNAKWKIESVELYLFENGQQYEAIFEIVTSPHEEPIYLEYILPLLECQGFPRPRDSYNYPIYPGMPEWGDLSMQERQRAAQIPVTILETMQTQTILQSLWEHPLLLYVLDTRYLWFFQNLIRYTNANQELIKRTDAGDASLYRLLMLNPLTQTDQNHPYRFEPLIFEILMSQMELLDQLSDGRKKQLIKTTLTSDSLRQENNISYDFRTPSWLLIGRTLINVNYAPFTEYLKDDENLERFLVFVLEEKWLTDHILLTIKKYAEEYLKGSECCENINDLVSEKCDDNCIFLNWSKPESSFIVEGYMMYRNDSLLTDQCITETSYLDENLPDGTYEYIIVVYYTDGCTSNISNNVVETINTVNINEITENSELLTFPNPVKDRLFFSEERQFEIYDMQGRLLLKSEQTTRFVNVSTLKSGIYLIKFKNGGIGKFIKE